MTLPQIPTIKVNLDVEALAQHLTHELNVTYQAIALLMDETYQVKKVALQNQMGLDLTAAQGGTHTMLHTTCCTFILGNHDNITGALWKTDTGVQAVQ